MKGMIFFPNDTGTKLYRLEAQEITCKLRKLVSEDMYMYLQKHLYCLEISLHTLIVYNLNEVNG